MKKIKSNWGEIWEIVPTKAETKQHDYYFSNHGRMKSVNKFSEDERLLKGSRMKTGYVQLCLTLKGGVRQGFYLHKLVADRFLERNEEQKFVVHLDGDLNYNHVVNLQWMTQREMTDHQIANGVYDQENRKRSKNTKMTETKVRLLRERLERGKTKRKILAKSFGITETQVRRIERRENWGHIE